MKINIESELRKNIQAEVIEQLVNLAKVADSNKQGLYLVGGMVRDLLLKKRSLDLDIVVEGNALELAKTIDGYNDLHIIKHDRFGTVTLSIGNFHIDIASARQEFYRKPGALPEVSPGNIKDDLSRRDFTINAMAIALNKANYGEFIDPHQGARDITNKLIRIIHAKSFADDATRIFRAIRYEQRLGFMLEDKTEKLIRQNLKMLNTISATRIKHELKLIFQEDKPEKIISRAGELRILHQIHPSLQSSGWLKKSYIRARSIVKKVDLPQVYMSLFIYNLHIRELNKLRQSLNPTRKEFNNLKQTLVLKTKIAHLKHKIKPSQIYKLLKPHNDIAILTNLIASDSSILKDNLTYYLTELRFIKTSLNGNRLIAMGITKGPEIGVIMQKLLEAKLDGIIKNIHEEKKLVNEFLASKYLASGD